MPVVAGDLVRYSSANEVTDDTSTVGGAIVTTSRPELTQLSANAVIAAISDGADTRTLTVAARKADGTLVTEAKALTGAVEILFNVNGTVERIESAVLGATDAARTVTLRQGAGGATIGTITPNETTRHIRFRNAASAAGIQDRYEKDNVRNGNATNALLSPLVQLTADPAARIKIGVATTFSDTVTSANRKTAPAGITFVDDNISPTMPTGSIAAAGGYVGVWINQSLPANDVAQKSTYTLTVTGLTT
jgi:hypothetical protein